MVIYGYAKDYRYLGDGTLTIKTRIPSVHGPYTMEGYNGNIVRNYVDDADLPYLNSVIMSPLPNDGDVLMLQSTNDTSSTFVVIGCTGGSYLTGSTNLNN